MRAWGLPVLWLGALLALSASPAAVESVYARLMYPLEQRLLTAVSNLAPFAWLDAWLALGVTLVVWRGARLVGVLRNDGFVAALSELTRRLIRAVALIVCVFMVAWGINYRRVPLEASLGAEPSAAPSVEELRGLLTEVAALAARTRPAAVEAPASYAEIAARLKAPFNDALRELGRPELVTFGRPKFTVLTPYFTWAGINGMLDPFGLESIVHPDALPFERPFVLAHEWAHLAGQADEAEASAVGWLACMHGDAALAYSGSVFLVVEVSDALPAPVWREMVPQLDPGLRVDLRALAARWRQTQPMVQRTASNVYDRYLRANGVDDGVKSYSRALSLILRPELRRAIRPAEE